MVSVSDEFKELAKQKESLEAEIKDLEDYLTEEGMPGLQGSLIDEEGFPRADLDLYAIRKARNRFACAQTDHKEVMKKIEAALFVFHAESRVAVPRQSPAVAVPSVQEDGMDVDAVGQEAQLPPPPFALVDEVTAGSPAADAGLALGDHVIRFGHVNRQDTGDLNACFAGVQELVPRSVGTPIEVQVLRGQ